MRIIFMGTPAFAVPTLDALAAAEHEIACVYTQPPRPAGRGKRLQPSAVQLRAEELGIEVRSPARLRDPAAQAAFAALHADIAVVAAYGLILPQAVLDAPRLGCVNVHASLLPRWRGAAPIQRAILAGDDVTGVTIMQMEAGLDTGPMLATREMPIGRNNAGELTEILARDGAGLLTAVLANLGDYPAQVQPEEGVTHAAKLDKAESRLNFDQTAEQVERQIRAFAPAPGAWFEHDGERIRILEATVAPAEAGAAIDTTDASAPALRRGDVLDDHLTIACHPGAIQPTRVQRAGRGVMTPDELLRGFAILTGTQLA